MIKSDTRTAASLAALLILTACGDDADSSGSAGDGMHPDHSMDMSDAANTNDDQLPPIGADDLQPWLEAKMYRDWSCESEAHEARSPSPHGFNRICSNDAIADYIDGEEDWPEGAAAVKELYASAGAEDPIGYAVYLKMDADSAGGDNWYWYEVVPDDSEAPHDADGVVADGMGDSGPAKSICVGCHAGAGSDDAHTPSVGGRDQVYTPVAH